MGRPPRADEAGGIYHALNRGNARHDIFFKTLTLNDWSPKDSKNSPLT
jgi:hypothetical protein